MIQNLFSTFIVVSKRMQYYLLLCVGINDKCQKNACFPTTRHKISCHIVIGTQSRLMVNWLELTNLESCLHKKDRLDAKYGQEQIQNLLFVKVT